MSDPTEVASTPDDLVDRAVRLMVRGSVDRRSAFHTPVLATVGSDGRAQARTVVLRGFDPVSRVVRIHTDVRAGKVAAVRRDPRIALVFYDAGARLQVRADATVSLHVGDAVAAEAWARSAPMARTIYAGPEGPGARLDGPQRAPAGGEGAFDRFCVLQGEIEALDVLSLRSSGHLRVRAAWAGGERSVDWLAP